MKSTREYGDFAGSGIGNAYEGEFSIGEDGKLYKGELNVESLYGTIDGLKEERNVNLRFSMVIPVCDYIEKRRRQ